MRSSTTLPTTRSCSGDSLLEADAGEAPSVLLSVLLGGLDRSLWLGETPTVQKSNNKEGRDR